MRHYTANFDKCRAKTFRKIFLIQISISRGMLLLLLQLIYTISRIYISLVRFEK